MNLSSALHDHFGFSEFRPGQEALITAVLSHRDALGVMPTGGGKSLCFQLPALLMEGTALVISPLIALMKDQVDALRARGIQAAAFHSGMSGIEKRDAIFALQSGKLKLLYMAPERMQQQNFLEILKKAKISFLAIDEAHCISHWGHDFRPDYRKLDELKKTLGVPVLALTATATEQVQRDIVDRLKMKKPAKVIKGFRRANLSFEVRHCAGKKEKFRELRALISEARSQDGSMVIYAATRKHVEAIAAELKRERAAYYHAGLSDEDRAEVQEAFLCGKKPVLVATNAFGMGIDKSNVRVVAHFDIPGSVEAYYQEAGRAGRDGKPGRCVLLFNYADVGTQDFFIQKSAEESAEESRDESAAEVSLRIENQRGLLKQLVRYSYAATCRQELILGYFGDEEASGFTGCGTCDNCLRAGSGGAVADESLTLACRQILSAVARVNGRFGKAKIAEMLKGSETAGIAATGLRYLPTFGLLKTWTLPAIREHIDLLSESGLLKITGLEYPLLSLSQEGLAAMKGASPIRLARAPSKQKRAKSDSAAASSPALLEALRDLRKREATERKIPAYLIFHDKTLGEIAERGPKSIEDLSEVSGLGPKKIELYGEKILALVSTHCG